MTEGYGRIGVTGKPGNETHFDALGRERGDETVAGGMMGDITNAGLGEGGSPVALEEVRIEDRSAATPARQWPL